MPAMSRLPWQPPAHAELDLDPIQHRFGRFTLVQRGYVTELEETAAACARDVPGLAREILIQRSLLARYRRHPADTGMLRLSQALLVYSALLVLRLAVIPPWWPVPAGVVIVVYLAWTVWSLRTLNAGRKAAAEAVQRWQDVIAGKAQP